MPFMFSNNSREQRKLDSKARRAATRAGYSIVKSKVRPGGYRLLDPQRHMIIAGDQFDLSAGDVLRLIASLGDYRKRPGGRILKPPA
jgi:hypothetical protein